VFGERVSGEMEITVYVEPLAISLVKAAYKSTTGGIQWRRRHKRRYQSRTGGWKHEVREEYLILASLEEGPEVEELERRQPSQQQTR
ncbi:hypothetical protein U1Q18_023741, partial [Sarracenia purpurea var. burkii]